MSPVTEVDQLQVVLAPTGSRIVLRLPQVGAFGNSRWKSACAVPWHTLYRTPSMPMSRRSRRGARLKSRCARGSLIPKSLRNEVCTASRRSSFDAAALKIAPLHHSIWLRTCDLKCIAYTLSSKSVDMLVGHEFSVSSSCRDCRRTNA